MGMNTADSCKLWPVRGTLVRPANEACVVPYIHRLLSDVFSLFGLSLQSVVAVSEIELVRHRPDILFLRTKDERVVGCVELKRPQVHKDVRLIEAPATQDQYARYLFWLLALGVRNPFVLVTGSEQGYVVALHDFSDSTAPAQSDIFRLCEANVSAEEYVNVDEDKPSPVKLLVQHARDDALYLVPALSVRQNVKQQLSADESTGEEMLLRSGAQPSEHELRVYKSQVWNARTDARAAFRFVATAVAHMLVADVRTVPVWTDRTLPLIVRTYTTTHSAFVVGCLLFRSRSDAADDDGRVMVSTGVLEHVELQETDTSYYVLHEVGRGASAICAAVLVRQAAAEYVVRALKIFATNNEETKARASD